MVPEDLPQFVSGPGGAAEPDRGADDGDRLITQDIGGERLGDPVAAVVERAGDRCVLLRGGEQDGVGPDDLVAQGAQRGDLIASGAGLVVFIERWYRFDQGRVEFNELDAGGSAAAAACSS
jgi:hypothetical protein